MAKRLVLLVLLLAFHTCVFAQRGNKGRSYDNTVYPDTTKPVQDYKPPVVKKPARDLIMLQLNYNTWLRKPDTVNTRTFGYSFNGYFCYDFPIKNSKFSFAAGIGIATSVIYLNQQVILDTGTSTAQFEPDTTHYKHYKLVTTYISAPFELRYFSNMDNRNVGFKAAIGLKIGTLLGGGTRGLTSIDGTKVKYKTDTKRFLSPWDFAATARIGWGNFSLFASYNLTNVFKVNEGPLITPAALGICVTGL
jgi:hypothetical protein